MNKRYANDMTAGMPTHPGVLIADELEARSMRQASLASAMQVSPSLLSDLIHARRNITADLALRLEKALDISALLWMNLQAKYQIDTLRKTTEVA
jgi:addiction module HigA family antidote